MVNFILKRLIKKYFSDLNFYRKLSDKNINRVFIDFLINRKTRLRPAIRDWIQDGYVKGHKPKR